MQGAVLDAGGKYEAYNGDDKEGVEAWPLQNVFGLVTARELAVNMATCLA